MTVGFKTRFFTPRRLWIFFHCGLYNLVLYLPKLFKFHTSLKASLCGRAVLTLITAISKLNQINIPFWLKWPSWVDVLLNQNLAGLSGSVGCLSKWWSTYWSRLTHSYLLKREDQPLCISCNEPFTVKHFLMDCIEFSHVRRQFFQTNDLRYLFEDVPADKTLTFLKHIKLFNKM